MKTVLCYVRLFFGISLLVFLIAQKTGSAWHGGVLLFGIAMLLFILDVIQAGASVPPLSGW